MNKEDNSEKIKILVCYYQPWEILSDDLFFPIQAAKASSNYNLNIQGDDTDDNISTKNDTYSEFTVWYWAWKNIKKYFPNMEYVGLSHYRRYFCMDKKEKRNKLIYSKKIPSMPNYKEFFINDLKKYDIILPKPEYYKYNLQMQYSYFHNSFDFACLRDIVLDLYPEYSDSFLEVFDNNKISLYCMFVAKFELFNKYFNWLFPILFEAERRINTTFYTQYQKRVLAFLGERLLNVYVHHNNLKVKYRPIFFIKDEIYENKVSIIPLILKTIKFIIKIILPYGLVILIKNRKHIENKIFWNSI